MRRLAVLGLFLSGCTTTFYGAAYYPGGAKSCQINCRAKGMEMSAFVFAGEYSTACVCGPRESEAAPTAAETTASSVAVATMIRQQQAAASQHH
jgi:hypothetical protein